MQIIFTVTAQVDRVSGKFAGKDEIEQEIQDALDQANPESISGVGVDGDSEYEITDWQVSA